MKEIDYYSSSLYYPVDSDVCLDMCISEVHDLFSSMYKNKTSEIVKEQGIISAFF